MNKLIYTALLGLVLLVPASALASTELGVFVTGLTPHRLDLKATETEDGGTKLVKGFTVAPEDVVQVNEGKNIIVFTQPPDRVDKVKITDATGFRTELVSLENSAYSTAGLEPGVYTLDVIVDLPDSNKRGGYGTILIVLEAEQEQISSKEVVQKTKVITEIDIDFEDDDRNDKKKKGNDCWDNGRFVGKDKCDTHGLPLCSENDRGSCFDEKDYPEEEFVICPNGGGEVEDIDDCPKEEDEVNEETGAIEEGIEEVEEETEEEDDSELEQEEETEDDGQVSEETSEEEVESEETTE